MTGKAAVLQNGSRKFEIKEYAVGKPNPGQALLRLKYSGVCGTDIHICNGKLGIPAQPTIIGHEFAGIIQDISEEDSKKYELDIGDNVIAYVAMPCGKCLLCMSGNEANCVNLNATYMKNCEEAPHFHGGFAEYSYCPISNLIRIGESIPIKTAAIFACAGPTIIHAVKSLSDNGRTNLNNIVVQGLGPVGLFAVLYFSKYLGVSNIIAITRGRNQTRLDLAKDFGATHFISIDNTSMEERKKTVLDATSGLGADCVIEASGNPAAFPEGLGLLRNRGSYLVVGQYSNSGSIEIEPHTITFKALEVIGSAQYTPEDVRDYICFLEKNPELWSIIDCACVKCFDLESINEAIDALRNGDCVKTLIVGK